MKRLIRRPLFAATLAAAAVLTRLGLSFAQAPAENILPRAGSGDRSANYLQLGKFAVKGDVVRERQALAAQDATTSALIAAYRQTQDEDEKARIVKALPGVVATEFDARQEIRERELKQLEEQLRKLQELHQRRAKQRDQIVEERVRQLLRDADGLGWGSEDEQAATISAKSTIDGQVIGSSSAQSPTKPVRDDRGF